MCKIKKWGFLIKGLRIYNEKIYNQLRLCHKRGNIRKEIK